MADVRISQDDTLITHLVGHVYSGVYGGPTPADNQKFHFEWHDPRHLAELMPSTHELVDALEKDDEPFLLSLDVTAK